MENNKTCHLYTYIFLLVLSFFLFSFNVKADTYNLTFDNSLFDILSSSTYSTIKNNADTYCESNNCTYYFTFLSNQGYRVNYYFPGNNSTNFIFQGTSSYMIYNMQGGGSWRACRYNYSTGVEISCDINQTYPNADIKFTFSNDIINSYSLLYSNLPSSAFTSLQSPTATTNIYNITYSNFTGSYSASNPYIPSLYDIYIQGNIVPDNTPILTTFYNLIIDKFSVIADFFVDNTYLFAIPLIPIFILCIYLIKRSLIK